MLGTVSLQGQAPYAGSQGDGYARVLATRIPVGITEKRPVGWRIGPNPLVEGAPLALQWPAAAGSLQAVMYDLQGRPVAQGQWSATQGQIDWQLPAIPAGLYVLAIRYASYSFTHKLTLHAR